MVQSLLRERWQRRCLGPTDRLAACLPATTSRARATDDAESASGRPGRRESSTVVVRLVVTKIACVLQFQRCVEELIVPSCGHGTSFADS